MEINSISLLFKCSQCRAALQSIREFLDHKLQNHLLEFKTTKCILFEEIILPDQDFTSNDETEFVNYSNEEDDGSLGVEQQSSIQFGSSESSSDQPKSSKRLKLNDYETETVVSSTDILTTTTQIENYLFDPLTAAIKREPCHDQQLIVPYFEDNFENPTLQSTSPYLLECDVKTAISQSRAETETETETETQENNSDEAFENFNVGSQEVEINVSDDNNSSDSTDSHLKPISSDLNSSTLLETWGYNFKVAKVKYEPDAFVVAESERTETESEPEPAEPEQDVVEILADLNDADGLQQAEIDPSDPDYEPCQNRRRSTRKIAFKSRPRSKNTTTIPHRDRDQDLVSMPKLVANKKTKSPTKTVPFVFPSYETFRRDSRKTTRKTNSKIDSDEDENDDDLRTWLLKQRSKSDSDENIILIQPDPIFNITSSTTVAATSKSSQSSKPATKTSPSNPIHCALCCTKLVSDEAVKVHVTYCWHKNKDKHRYCVPCKKTFSSAYLLQRHNDKIFLQEVEDKDPSFGGPKKYHLFKCRHCLQGFAAQMYLNHHIHSQHRRREKGGKNTSVSKKFPGSGSGSRSLRSSTSTNLRRNYASTSASASATKAKPANQEYLIVHDGLKRQEAVLKRGANQVRKRKTELKQKSVAGNAQSAQSIECKVCERIFDISNLRQFRTHMQSHFRSEARNFNCQFPNCTQAFKSELSLEIHFKAHTIGKAIVPDNASPGPSVAIQDFAGENTFVDVSKPPLLELELEPEPKLADQSTNDKYRRPIFSSAKKVVSMSNHGVENLSALEKQKNFMKVRSVNVADSIISRMLGSKLKKSSRRRLLLPPLFKCQICNWTFGTKKALQAHALVHLTEESAFKCTFAGCVRSFKEKCQLEQHLLAHQGKKTKI